MQPTVARLFLVECTCLLVACSPSRQIQMSNVFPPRRSSFLVAYVSYRVACWGSLSMQMLRLSLNPCFIASSFLCNVALSVPVSEVSILLSFQEKQHCIHVVVTFILHATLFSEIRTTSVSPSLLLCRISFPFPLPASRVLPVPRMDRYFKKLLKGFKNKLIVF